MRPRPRVPWRRGSVRACSGYIPRMTWLSPLELAAAVLSALGVWLTARERIASWPVGIVGLVLYAWVFQQSRLYGEMGLQFVFVAISAYGWWHWVHGDRASGAPAAPAVLRVTRM